MTTTQAFFAIAGLMVTLFALAAGFFRYYIDAKIDPLSRNVGMLVQYMVSHEGKISRLEERTK
jgi:uncharacterized membrane protein (GlpM family)